MKKRIKKSENKIKIKPQPHCFNLASFSLLTPATKHHLPMTSSSS